MIRVRPAAAAALLALCACNPQAPSTSSSPSPSASAAKSGPSLHISGQGTAKQPVRWIGRRKDNRIEYELLADSFESVGPQGKARAVFQNARVTFYDKNGATLAATAPQAIVDQTQNTITLVNGVHAKTGTGMTLQCDQLVYDHDSEMLHGTGHVVMTDPQGFRGTGNSFDSDISLTMYRMR